MRFKCQIVLFALMSFFIGSCSAPQIDDDFLTDEYYLNTKTNKQNGSSRLQSKVDSLILELSRVQFRLLQTQLDYLTLSNNMMNLQLHTSELKLMQHLKEHELTALENKLNETINAPELSTAEPLHESANADQPRKTANPNIAYHKRNEFPDKNSINIADQNRNYLIIFSNMYEEGILLFNKKKYREAMEKFRALLEMEVKDSALVDNSYYWLGEVSFALGDYTLAVENFKKVLEFKDSNKNADAMLMLGQTYEKLEWKELAKDVYQKYINRYPESKNSALAKNRLKNLL